MEEFVQSIDIHHSAISPTLASSTETMASSPHFSFPEGMEEPPHALWELTASQATNKRKRKGRFAGKENVEGIIRTQNDGIPLYHEVQKLFHDENETVEYLLHNGVLVRPSSCPLCDSKWVKRKAEYPKDQCFVWRCNNPFCGTREGKGTKGTRWQQSFFHGTFFANSRKKKNEVFHFLWLMLTGATSKQIQATLGWSSGTVADYSRWYRELLTQSIRVGNTEQIGGNGIIVEIDESKFGKRKYNRGHRVEGAWVFGGVERTAARRMFAVVVADRTADTLLPLIARYIAPGSIVHSDCWRAYYGIEKMVDTEEESFGYIHRTVNHSVCYVNPDDGTHTNTIEGTWFGIKQGIRPRRRNKKLLDGHLFEFMWRRENAGRMWKGLLEALTETVYLDGEEEEAPQVPVQAAAAGATQYAAI